MQHFMRVPRMLFALVLVLATASRAQETVLLNEPRDLPAGQKLELKLNLAEQRAVALRVTMKDADFGGATILTRVNDHDLLPYHAFGGDTRYDSVRGKPGMNPPIAKIEANYSLIASWVNKGDNSVTITNAGPGLAKLESIAVRPVSGHDLPVYQNSIYFDFDVWRQGIVMRPSLNPNLNSMLLGILPGAGAFVMNYSGGDGMALKLTAEDARVNWGYRRSTFYSIWHLVTTAPQWCEFIDVDKKPVPPEMKVEKPGKIHVQFADASKIPPGTDVALIKPDGYLNVLKPGIDGLLAYSTDYNFTCEQWGPRGQGFGRWWGDKWAAAGYDGTRWAENYQTEFSKLAGYVHQKNPKAPVMSPHWWLPDIRFLLYDTSLARGKKMRDMTDAMMTHYCSFTFADYAIDGRPQVDDDQMMAPNARPELQYPGGKFERPDWERSRAYMGSWLLIPEIAIDWNRYRLSKTEKDMKLGDPKVNRWANGKPFTFEAGFDGDEQAYSNETCIYDRQYSATSPYQFLYAMFNYSLLPTADSEATEFKVTRTMPLTPEDKPKADVFTEVDQPINRYGEWVKGAAGTHRLKTRDPLYGDLFGYTGFEQATTGDYIWLSGIQEPHHRRAGANAWNLIRRTCYAFVTAAPVYPAIVNDPDTNSLFVKTLVVKQDGRDVIGIYASNFDSKPHTLDVTIPALWTGAATAQVFDEKAGDWSHAVEQQVTPAAGVVRQKVALPPNSPWCMFIYAPPAQISRAFSAATVPQPLSPWGNVNVATAEVTLKWRPSAQAAKYEIQVAKEMLFRTEDAALTQDAASATELKIAGKLQPNHRYHWRVRAIDAGGNSSNWSQPQSFWFQAGAGATAATPATPEAPPQEAKVPRPDPQPDIKPFTDADNLAHAGIPFSHPNYWEGAGKAVDGFAGSLWLPDTMEGDEGRRPDFPAWWAVRFDQEQTISDVGVLWAPDKIGKDFEIQIWDTNNWKVLKVVRDNKDARSMVKLAQPVKTRAARIWINAPVTDTAGIAEVYIH